MAKGEGHRCFLNATVIMIKEARRYVGALTWIAVLFYPRPFGWPCATCVSFESA